MSHVTGWEVDCWIGKDWQEENTDLSYGRSDIGKQQRTSVGIDSDLSRVLIQHIVIQICNLTATPTCLVFHWKLAIYES